MTENSRQLALSLSPTPAGDTQPVELDFLSPGFVEEQWALSDGLEEGQNVVSVGMGGSALPIRALKREPLGRSITVVDHPETDLIDRAAERGVHLVGVSKSGQTLETRRILQELLDRGTWGTVTVVTGKGSPLAERAAEEGWRMVPFTAECDGRFGLFAAATLTPFRIAGHDPAGGLTRAARSEQVEQLGNSLGEWLGTRIESGVHQLAILCYEEHLWGLGNWLAQLVGESLGKRDSGIFPSVLMAPAAHHSVFQHLEQGDGGIAVLQLAGGEAQASGGRLERLRRVSFEAARDTLEGERPLATLEVPRFDYFNLGAVGKAFVHAVFRAADIVGVNPEGQPGVENLKDRLGSLWEEAGAGSGV